MSYEKYVEKIGEAISANPKWFLEAEKDYLESNLHTYEEKTGLRLPSAYKEFLSEFGSGYFGRIWVSSIRKDSPFYVENYGIIKFKERVLFPASDDGCGGFYGFIDNDGALSENVFYWHPDDGGEFKKVSENFFEFVINFAVP